MEVEKELNNGSVQCDAQQCPLNLPPGYTYQRGNVGVIFVKEVVCATSAKVCIFENDLIYTFVFYNGTS
jgi:hypothetical protein